MDVTGFKINVNGLNVDQDIEFRLSRDEVDGLSSTEVKATIIYVLNNAAPGLGAIASVFILDKINDIQSRTGISGASVQMSIRNGVSLSGWNVGGIETPWW